MSLQYNLLGNGASKVIVLHDWSQDITSNDPILPYLDTKTFSFAMIDIRGYGQSIDQTGDYTVNEVVADVFDVIDKLGWSKFSLIGHSMTGMIAQKIAAEIPEKLNRLVLATPVPASGMHADDETLGFFNSMVDDDESFKAGMSGLTGARYTQEWGDYKLAKNRQTVNPQAMRGYCKMWARGDFSNEMKILSMPTLLICGKYDDDNLKLNAIEPKLKAWFSNLKRCELNCGHYPMQESPVEYACLVQEF